MIILLNGPLGIGKSTLAEALSERMPQCVMLDGDHLIAANPRFPDELEHLHSTVALLVAHHRRFGYRHFVITHIWTSPQAITDLRSRLAAAEESFKCFLLTLPLEENLRRIERRANARALDESEFEQGTVKREREALADNWDEALGVPFDVSAPLQELVAKMLSRLEPYVS
jgi:thymidylate kinase